MRKLEELYTEARNQFYLDLKNEIINHPEKSYATIATEMRTSLPMVHRVVTLFSLNRPTGPKPKQPVLTKEQKQQARMLKGCCAVHGLPISVHGYLKNGVARSINCPEWRLDNDGTIETFVGHCCRKGCRLLYTWVSCELRPGTLQPLSNAIVLLDPNKEGR